jgi:hypothetical protein
MPNVPEIVRTSPHSVLIRENGDIIIEIAHVEGTFFLCPKNFCNGIFSLEKRVIDLIPDAIKLFD